jgi:16S rRNA processing protein RimM
VDGHAKELLRCKIKGIEDRTAAETLIGTGLYVSRDKLPETDSDEYYQADLIGLDVRRAADHESVGKVVGFYNFGAGDILEIKKTADGQTEMLPFTKAYVPEIEPRLGYLIVSDTCMNFAPEEEESGVKR